MSKKVTVKQNVLLSISATEHHKGGTVLNLTDEQFEMYQNDVLPVVELEALLIDDEKKNN